MEAMHLDISHVLAAEQVERLRESAQASLGLTALLGRLFRSAGAAGPAGLRRVDRAQLQSREIDRLAA